MVATFLPLVLVLPSVLFLNHLESWPLGKDGGQHLTGSVFQIWEDGKVPGGGPRRPEEAVLPTPTLRLG